MRTGDHPAQPQQDEKGKGNKGDHNEGDKEEGDGHDDNMYVFFLVLLTNKYVTI